MATIECRRDEGEMLKAVGNFVLEQLNNLGPLRRPQSAKPQTETCTPERQQKRKRGEDAEPDAKPLANGSPADTADEKPLERELSLAVWKDGGGDRKQEEPVEAADEEPAEPADEPAVPEDEEQKGEERPRRRRRNRRKEGFDESDTEAPAPKLPKPAPKRPKTGASPKKASRLSKASKAEAAKPKSKADLLAGPSKDDSLQTTAPKRGRKGQGRKGDGWAAMDKFYRAELEKAQQSKQTETTTAE